MDFDKVLSARVSSRKFVGGALSDEEIEKLLDAAKKSPIASGRYESIYLTVIRNEEFIREISDEYNVLKNKKEDSLYGSKTFIIVSSNKEDTSKYEDTGCILENITLKATEMGLGSCYIRGLVNGLGPDANYIKKLDLPEGFYPVSGIILGKVDEKLSGKDHQMKVNYID